MKTVYFFLLMIFTCAVLAEPLSTSFTYQGQLKTSNELANGPYDFQFKAFDTDGLSGNLGTNLATVQLDTVNVVNGVFTVQLDFVGVVFQGDKVWLEIAVRNSGSSAGYQQLLPRQEVTSAPYAIQAQFVIADAITSVEIRDNSINSTDLAPNSVGANEINSSQIQKRVVSSCGIGSFISSINIDGTVICSNESFTSYKLISNSCINTSSCTIQCPAGLNVLGGGCETTDSRDIITSNTPTSDGLGWSCTGTWSTVKTTAICAVVN